MLKPIRQVGDNRRFEPSPSLWSRYNKKRGGGVTVEDVLMFSKSTL